jgi:hypothetical protein
MRASSFATLRVSIDVQDAHWPEAQPLNTLEAPTDMITLAMTHARR